MKMRAIRHNASTRTAGNVAFFDTETLPAGETRPGEPILHRLRLWSLSGGRLENGQLTRTWSAEGTTPEHFWAVIARRLDTYRPLWLWAHNTGFDLTALRFWECLETGEYAFEEPIWRTSERKARQPRARQRHGLCVIDSPPLILRLWHRGGGQLVIVDTFNWFQSSLETLGQSIGVPKYPMPPFGEVDELWQVYCNRDTAIVERAVVSLHSFIRKHDLGVMKYTAAGQSMAAFQHRFMDHEILVHDDQAVKAREREAYYAGRVEPFYLGHIPSLESKVASAIPSKAAESISDPCGPVYLMDLCSMYPSVMRTNLYPRKIIALHKDVDFATFDRVARAGSGCAAVRIGSNDADYPVRHQGEVYYVTGAFRTVLCGPELRRASEMNHVFDCPWMIEYEMAPLFTRYVDFFWDLRQYYRGDNNSTYANLCKLMMNSLYGKFGQMASEWKDEPGEGAPIPWGAYIAPGYDDAMDREYRSIAWHPQHRQGRQELPTSMPIISAFVTSYGREVMREARRMAGEYHTYYQGVDSLMVDAIGSINLRAGWPVLSGGLGGFSEKCMGDDAHVYGQHSYRVGTTVVEGWHSRKATKLGEGTYLQTEFRSVAELLAGKPPPGPVERSVIKRATDGKARGVKMASGFVRPFVYHEELA